MIIIESNGTRVEADNEKEARKALARLTRESRKRDAQAAKDRELARMRSEAKAYNAIRQKATNGMPRAWIFYQPHDKYSCHLFKRTDNIHNDYTHTLTTEHNESLAFEHYGYELLGCICNGSGYVWAVVMRDRTTRETTVYAIGVEADSWALAELYGIKADDFRTKDDSEAA